MSCQETDYYCRVGSKQLAVYKVYLHIDVGLAGVKMIGSPVRWCIRCSE